MHALIRCGFYSFGLQKLCFYTPDQFSSIPPAFLSFLQSFHALVFFSVYVSFSSAFRLLFVTQVFKRKGNASRFEPEFVSLPAGHFTTLGHIGITQRRQLHETFYGFRNSSSFCMTRN